MPLRTDTPTAGSRARRTRASPVPAIARNRWATVGAFVLLVASLVASPLVLGEYARQILSQAFFFAIAAITVDLLWGYTGILTFGQSAFFGIGVYTLALGLAYYLQGAAGTAAAIVGAMVLAAVIGGAVGWLSFWDRASPIYVAIVTLALPVVFTQIILSGGAYTGSSSGLPIPVPALSITQWYWISGGCLLVVAMLAYVLVSSDAGRVLVAIRENEERCRYLGLKTSRQKIWLMAACGAVAALAGSCYALFASVAAPSYGDFVFGTQLVVWTALGGRGTLIGPVLGTVAVNYVSAVLGGDLPFVWLLFVGLAFVLVVVYLPKGLVPAIGTVLSRVTGAVGPLRGARVGAAPRQEIAREVRVVSAGSMRGWRQENGMSAQQETPVLELRDVSKRYGSLEVLHAVSLEARRGEVVGIVGPNGAGKTTLLRCIADGRERSGGEVIINRRRVGRLPPEDCVALGVSRKFQTPNVFEALSVMDCLAVARSYRVPTSLRRKTEILELPAPALHAVQVSGLLSVLDELAGQLSHGAKQALELAMVLALEPTVLLLDEPTAGLTRNERAAIGSVLVELAHSHRLCILLIEHDLDFVREISTRLIVLHMGKVLADGPIAEVAESQVIRTIYIGGAPRP